ncbi:MAG: DUF2953 domain-containing protein [candidate division Zixibacteria bacterium]|nr:DUF2953 domain-containing protein [candidate division Zixibacteria bacterium]
MISALYLILFFVIILILTGLFLPVHLHLILNEKRKSISLGWFFMVLGADLVSKTFELRLFSKRIISRTMRKKRKEKEEVKKVKKKKKKGRGFDVSDLWKERDLLSRVLCIFFRFLKDMLRRIHLDRFFVEADIATPDPALTGTIYGGLYAVCVSVNSISPNLRLKVQPDFQKEVPSGNADIAISTKAIDVVGAILKMFFDLPKIKIIRTFIKRKRR